MSCNGFFCSEDSLCKMCRMKNSTKLILDTFVPYFKNKGDFESVKILENYFDLPDWQLKELYKFFKVDPWDINSGGLPYATFWVIPYPRKFAFRIPSKPKSLYRLIRYAEQGFRGRCMPISDSRLLYIIPLIPRASYCRRTGCCGSED